MKKLYIALLSLFCIAHTVFGQISEAELLHEMEKQSESMPMEDQKRIAHIKMLAQTNRQDQLTQDDVDFYHAKQKQLVTNATDAIVKAKKIAAEQAKKTAKALVTAFRSAPQGPCPYTDKDIKQKELLEKTIALINEVVYYNKNNTPLETAIANHAPEYKIKSKATSPYHAALATIDGTTAFAMTRNGKLTFCKKEDATEPENEFNIEIIALDDDKYQIDITGYNTCNVPKDYFLQSAHANLAICCAKYLVDQNKNQDEDEKDSTIQTIVEGQDYKAPSLLWRSTYCSDHHIQIICTKEHLIYSIKDALAPKKSWMSYAAEMCYNDPKKVNAMRQAAQAMQAADNLESASKQEKNQQDTRTWTEWNAKIAANAKKELQYYGSFFSWKTAATTTSNDTGEQNNVVSDRKTDLQQIQEKEVNTAS